MTNHWADIANSTFVLVWGANPVENHPACIAHINRARFPKQFFNAASDTAPHRADKQPAKLIVIDPRQTRTALQCDPARGDRYIRIRPGTDIAMENAILKTLIEKMESGVGVSSTVQKAFFGFLNQYSNGSFYTDGGAALASSLVTTVPKASKYTDARFLVRPDGKDYQRHNIVATTGLEPTTETGNLTITNFPKMVDDCRSDSNTVYNRLKAHVAPYTLAVAADICGCSEDDILFVVNALIENSRPSGTVAVTDASIVLNGTTATGVQGATSVLVVNGTVVVTDGTGATTYVENVDYTVDYTTGKITRKGAGIPDGSTVLVDYQWLVNDPRDPRYRATTMLYAMGQTQHTYGSQNIKGFANIQSILGNMGRAGGGINALRGIHNVQGSTDMGLLFGNIPAYSSNPAVGQSYGDYMNGLWGNPLSGSTGTTDFSGTARTKMDDSFDDAYNTGAAALGAMGLQQRGFFNMTLKWFGGYSQAIAATTLAARKAIVDAAYSLWPKGNGDDHVTMFRQMNATTGYTKALVCWGQNPAVSEPNQKYIRDGLRDLDLLVCVDMFQNETAAADRKGTGITYLIPAAAHTEKAGSATNSGRTLQWRYRAAAPAGNSKDDTELLLRLAKALDTANGFDHIKTVWDGISINTGLSVYDVLYGTPYGYAGGAGYEALSGRAESVKVRPVTSDPLTYNGTQVTNEAVTLTAYGTTSLANTAGLMPLTVKNLAGTVTYSAATDYVVNYATGTIARRNNAAAPFTTITDGETVNVTYMVAPVVTGSEWVSELIYREMNLPSANGGTIWIYTGAYNNTATAAIDNKAGAMAAWPTMNRAKSRDNTNYQYQLHYWGWGYSWLVNRRVFYNNGEVLGDVADFYMEPESCVHLFAAKARAAGETDPTVVGDGLLNYSRWYRHNHTLKDLPSPVVAGTLSSPHFAGGSVSVAGRFPAFTEPYESPRADLAAKWGHNTKGAAWDLVKSDTRVAGRGFVNGVGGKPVTDPPVSSFPLVLTTIRCVEHFQGGPITRNNWWNVELEPEPWIEINSADAKYFDGTKIADGDRVRIVTARMVNDAGVTQIPARYGDGFIARVGSGLSAGQKVGRGVVAIPWHWGETGLAPGSRANDMCIDAVDANSSIPESKACLCRLEKI